jgi:hypothetical protein
MSRDSSVGIELGYGLDDRGSRVRFPAGAGNFSLHYRVQAGSGAHQSSYPLGCRGSFLGVKRPGREADHSPPPSAEVKECVELYLDSKIYLHAVVLTEAQGQFTFNFAHRFGRSTFGSRVKVLFGEGLYVLSLYWPVPSPRGVLPYYAD